MVGAHRGIYWGDASVRTICAAPAPVATGRAGARVGVGAASPLNGKENENGYFLVVFHAFGSPADHQTEVIGSVAQTADLFDRTRTEIENCSARAPAGNDEPARLSGVPLHRHQR